jgi:Ca2+-binding RTX toxin-like protein
MRVSHRGSQALALGAGVASLLAIVAPHGYAASARPMPITNLTFTKTVSPGPYTAGAPLTYTLTLAANGGAVNLGTLTDPLPAGLVVTSVTTSDPGTPCTVTPPTTGTPTTTPVSQTVNCPVGVIGNTSSLTVTIVAVPVDPGTFTNTATVPQAAPGTATATATAGPITVGGQSLRCFGFVPTQLVVTTPGPNTIDGTNGPDVIIGGPGNDTIDGEGGDDYICGAGGNDHLYGGSGNDHLAGGRGSDFIDGGAGHNVLRGGRDTIGFGPFTASTDHRWRHRGHDRDTLVCQRGIDDCRSGFGGDRGDRGDGRGGWDGRGDNNVRIIFIPERGDRFGRDGDGRFNDFSAKKGAPAKSVTKPVAKPMVKPEPKQGPAVAGTAPVAPKA